MSSILDFRGLYFCAAYLPTHNLRRISTIYLRGYWKDSENGRVVARTRSVLNRIMLRVLPILFFSTHPVNIAKFTEMRKSNVLALI
jgi:hypothetical protein